MDVFTFLKLIFTLFCTLYWTTLYADCRMKLHVSMEYLYICIYVCGQIIATHIFRYNTCNYSVDRVVYFSFSILTFDPHLRVTYFLLQTRLMHTKTHMHSMKPQWLYKFSELFCLNKCLNVNCKTFQFPHTTSTKSTI